ncbi:hypothetical protein D3C73_1258590 [compost metagenome]
MLAKKQPRHRRHPDNPRHRCPHRDGSTPRQARSCRFCANQAKKSPPEKRVAGFWEVSVQPVGLNRVERGSAQATGIAGSAAARAVARSAAGG